ncbi:MAG: permease-like cell division protein FtsX [Muribaculaceae bacterium]|nr:permease-like cell division protein FtsX [Muribaculaceae bacterium]
MKGKKEVKISYWAAHLTTIVSVTLVLLIIGVIALTSIGAAVETQRLKEKIEISVVMADSVSDDRAAAVCSYISSEAYALETHLITRQEALDAWTAETGEDLQALFGVNPLSPEVVFRLRAEYTSPDSIAAIAKQLETLPQVESVAVPDSEMVVRMNHNIERATWVLAAIAIVLIVISFVLINNTVHLAVYARRFTIHTMQLVGATNGFIRWPYIRNNLFSGILAGCIATGLLALGMVLSASTAINLSTLIGWVPFGIVGGGLVVLGALLCGLSAGIATSRYLHKDYDQLFR